MKFFSFEHLSVVLMVALILALNKSEVGVLIAVALYGSFLAMASFRMLAKQLSEFEARLDKLDEIMKGLK